MYTQPLMSFDCFGIYTYDHGASYNRNYHRLCNILSQLFYCYYPLFKEGPFKVYVFVMCTRLLRRINNGH